LFSNREIITKYAEAIYELFRRIGEKLVEGLAIKSEKNGFEKLTLPIQDKQMPLHPWKCRSPVVQIDTDSSSSLFSKMMKELVV